MHSVSGLDGISQRVHCPGGPGPPSNRPRPLVLQHREAVYFDHDLGRLRELADTAASIGVERFVLDDGWFGGRRDDRRGLGDWWVSPDVWPDGLGPLVEHVKGWAWSSACGSSRRWSTPTPTSCANTPTGCWVRVRDTRASGGTSR